MRELDIATLTRLDDRLKKGRGLPVNWMYDTDHYAFEQSAVFDRSWRIVATAHDLQVPGRFVTAPLGDAEIIVLRDQQGDLRGYHNVCRHRGHRLAQGQGTCRTLSCPYHAWTYGLDGRLRGAPGLDLSERGARKELALMPVAIEAWGPVVFANLDTDARPLNEEYPELQALVDRRGIDTHPESYLNDYTMALKERISFAANWKLWYDNNVECYHCGPLHSASFSSAFDPDPATMRIDMVGRLISYGFNGIERPESNGPVSADYRSVELYPGNFVVLHDELMMVYAMHPTGPTTGEVNIWYLGRSDADPARLSEWITLWQQTFAEDIAAIEVQAQMLPAAKLPHLVYVPGHEDTAIFINHLTLNALKAHVATAS